MDEEAGVLARPYLMMLHVNFPIYFNFPIRSKCVLKAIIQRKKQWIVLQLLDKVFFFEMMLFMISYRTYKWYLINFSY